MNYEYGRCQVCGKENILERTYFHYGTSCECHDIRHIVMRRHCATCTPHVAAHRKVDILIEDVKTIDALRAELAKYKDAENEGRILPNGFSCVELSDGINVAVFYPQGKGVMSEIRQAFTVSEAAEAAKGE